MNTAPLTQKSAEDELHFDGHEFDGLRALDEEAQSLVAKGDQFVRKNPWLCVGLAAVVGFSVICAARRK